MDLTTHLNTARTAAQAGAQVLNAIWCEARADGAHAGVVTQRGKDIKTRADVESESAIYPMLEATGLPVLSEERGADAAFAAGGTGWVVDPLDGTMNLVRGFGQCCVSVGLWVDGRPAAGVIHDFVHDRVWWGAVGHGAWCDGEPVACSNASGPEQAMLTTGFPGGRSFEASALSQFVDRVRAYKKIRMIGSAAMSLAHVSSGTMDLYFEEDIYLWDVAAGMALVEAAGGTADFTPVDASWRTTVIAGAPALVARERS